MYEIISVLRQSAIVLDFDVLELIDEDSVKLIKIKAVLKENWLLYITELHTKDYQKEQRKGTHLNYWHYWIYNALTAIISPPAARISYPRFHLETGNLKYPKNPVYPVNYKY